MRIPNDKTTVQAPLHHQFQTNSEILNKCHAVWAKLVGFGIGITQIKISRMKTAEPECGI
jgi:hypothetical protein